MGLNNFVIFISNNEKESELLEEEEAICFDRLYDLTLKIMSA